MALLLVVAFFSGLVTILTPCIWPLLPIVLSTAVAGKGRARPLGITLGIMLSFAFFTLAISFLISLFHLDPNFLRLLAVAILVVFGLSMLLPRYAAFLEIAMSRLSGKLGRSGQTGSGFSGGFIAGLSLGIVWSPCAGPILASIATLAATGAVSLRLVLITGAYVLGVGIPLFFFAYGSQRLIRKTKLFSQYTGRIQQGFGVLLLLTAVAIATNYDKLIEAQLLSQFPAYTNLLTAVEGTAAVQQQLAALKGQTDSYVNTNLDAQNLFNANIPAPEFTGITKWLNTTHPVTLQELRGKVVLVDFWTYTCINCIRTFPYLKEWYTKYHRAGLEIIGVHTPEFAFEHDTGNVSTAISRFGIAYPVAQDNNLGTWNAYQNDSWPAEYLIDKNGVIRRVHLGEGEYQETEKAIQVLLQDAGKKVSAPLTTKHYTVDYNQISQETYLGSSRMEFLFPNGSVPNGTQTFQSAPTESPLHSFVFNGTWTITDDHAASGDSAAIFYHFTASHVYLVARPGANKQAIVRVLLNNKPVTGAVAGKDVQRGMVTIDSDRLYDLLDFSKDTEGTLQLEFDTPGTQVFTFTFG